MRPGEGRVGERLIDERMLWLDSSPHLIFHEVTRFIPASSAVLLLSLHSVKTIPATSRFFQSSKA